MQAAGLTTNPTAIAQVDGTKATAEKESMIFGEYGLRAKRTIQLGLLALFVVLCIVVAIVIAQITATNGTEESAQDSAFFTLQEMMEDGVDTDDHAAFDAAFDTFDTNHDGVLDEVEFSGFFEREMLCWVFLESVFVPKTR